MKKFESAIFDLDGTIADTLTDLANSTNWALTQLGFPTHPVEKYRFMVGSGRRELCRRALPKDKEEYTEKMMELMTEHYHKHFLDNTKLYPDIHNLLKALNQANIKLAVLSNKPHIFVELTIKNLCPDIKFDYIAGEIEGIPRKPDPTGALKIAQSFQIPPEKFIYVGDTAIDMQTAINAGMFPIGVTWGFRDRDELTSSGAKLIVETPMEIYKFITDGAKI